MTTLLSGLLSMTNAVEASHRREERRKKKPLQRGYLG
jgi:hypothetical protein